MIPIPQYPLYSATITMCGGHKVGYFLDEHANWSLHAKELERSIADAAQKGVSVRAICVINPGNPTGMDHSIELISPQHIIIVFQTEHFK
jgi:alanine transaminase